MASDRARPPLTLEQMPAVVLEMQASLCRLMDEVMRLNQAVVQLSRQERAALPLSVRAAIVIPSVAVTLVCVVWLAMQMRHL